ncbi:MAG: inositol monophosphatase, partial [Gemmatimonadetes bacterium]|nr:inositol monophosphatase [Gemmatimonadota bacterium]
MSRFIESVAREAGALLRERFARQKTDGVRFKGEKDPVTEADHASQDLIVRLIREKFPSDRIVAEEDGADSGSGDSVWYVDPLDGTTNFLHRFPFFSVSIARVKKDEIVCGVVYNPVTDDCFTAEAGGGAWHNGTRVRVDDEAGPLRSIIATGFACVRSNRVHDTVPFFDSMVREVQGVRRAGSAALDLSFTARGTFGAFYELNLNPWDIAAGILLVKEAGGIVTDFTGGSGMFERKEVVAGGAAMHSYVLGRIRG